MDRDVTGAADIPAARLRERVARVAARSLTYRYYHWDWGEAVAIEGLWAAWRITGERRFFDFARRMIEGWMAHSPDPWYPDHVGPGRTLLDLWEETGDLRFLGYARRLGEHLAHLPRAACGGYFHRPDLPDRARMIWVDSMQTDAPFLCRLGRATEEGRWYDAAAEHIAGHIAALQDPATGLFHHNYDDARGRANGVFWGRGNGWAALGLVHTLEALPKGHAGHAGILRGLEGLAGAILAWQDGETGLWRTVVDRPETYLEGSVSLMFANTLMRGGRAGALSAECARAGERAWGALWDQVTPEGVVKNVSQRTPPRERPADYTLPPVGGLYPWGQGPYLLAAATWLEGKD
jgi:unsaturated rhamnogalacturonyl hydrolase